MANDQLRVTIEATWDRFIKALKEATEALDAFAEAWRKRP
jgi:hypothetical protein